MIRRVSDQDVSLTCSQHLGVEWTRLTSENLCTKVCLQYSQAYETGIPPPKKNPLENRGNSGKCQENQETSGRIIGKYVNFITILHNRFVLFFLLCRLRRLFQAVLVCISSPPFIIFLMTVVYSYFTTETDNYHEIMQNSKTLYSDGILSSLRDSVLIGTWSYPVTMLVILPNWLLFWSIAWM